MLYSMVWMFLILFVSHEHQVKIAPLEIETKCGTSESGAWVSNYVIILPGFTAVILKYFPIMFE